MGPKQIESHLKGEDNNCSDVIGVYPLFPNGTCRFLVFDFDNHCTENDDYGFDDNDVSWIEEVEALRTICRLFDIPVLVERSRSGKGAHVWIFLISQLMLHLQGNLVLLYLKRDLNILILHHSDIITGCFLPRMNSGMEVWETLLPYHCKAMR